MAGKANNFWLKAKDPVLFTMLGALLVLSIKTCGDGNKARETNEIVKDVATNVDTIKQNTDTVKATVKAVHKIVTRTEKKVDVLQETADSILAKVDSCCDCEPKHKPIVQPVKKRPAEQPLEPMVVVNVNIHQQSQDATPDTVPAQKPVKKFDTVYVGRVVCRDYYL